MLAQQPSARVKVRHAIDAAPVVPLSGPSGSIPTALLETGISAVVKTVTDAFPFDAGDIICLHLDSKPLDGACVTLNDPPGSEVEFRLTPDVLSSLLDGVHALHFTVETLSDIHISRSTAILIDRSPAGGGMLPPLIFDASIALHGISLAALRKHHGGVLHAVIPNYQGQRPDDRIEISVTCERTGQRAVLANMGAGSGTEPIRADVAESSLSSFRGMCMFDYVVHDIFEQTSRRSKASSVALLFDSAPAKLPPPVVISSKPGKVDDADARPATRIAVPTYGPTVEAEDSHRLWIGDMACEAPALGIVPSPQSPVRTIDVPYARLIALSEAQGSTSFVVPVFYEVIRDGIASPSEEVRVAFDLELPGGADPNAETPENEALPRPILTTQKSTAENLVRPAEIDAGAVLRVDFGAAIDPKNGDVIQMYINDTPVGTPANVENDPRISVEITGTQLRECVGARVAWYTVTRSRSDATTVARSPASAVRILDESFLPGGGKGLPAPVCLDCQRLNIREGKNVIRKDSYDPWGWVRIRLHEYINMQLGDHVAMRIELLDRSQKPVSGSLLVLEHSVDALDVIPRHDYGLPGYPTARFCEFLYPAALLELRATGYVRAEATVTNAAGSIAASAKFPMDHR